MAVFGKKVEGGGSDESDYLRIPPGTRIGSGPDGKLMMSFAGDMSLGEPLPELSEIHCGRNFSVDAGVTIRADSVRVKASLELEQGAKLIAKEIEVERLVSRKGQIEARSIQAGQVDLEGSRVVADRMTARDGVVIDRGEVEIGTVTAQTLTVTKGTIANILVAEVTKLDGAITKGGYENFNEFLSKVLLYHPEVLNERFLAEARKLPGAPPENRNPEEADLNDPVVLARIGQEGQKLRGIYGAEVPREIQDLLGLIEQQRMVEVRKSLNPTYQRLAAQNKMPEVATETFREIQKLLRQPVAVRREAAARTA